MLGERAVPQVVAGAIAYGKQCDWRMLDLTPWGLRIPDFVHPDGIIACLGDEKIAIADRLRAKVAAVVSLDSPLSEDESPAGVGVRPDAARGGAKCAEYMLGRGFRNFAICSYSDTDWDPGLKAFEDRVIADGATATRIRSLGVGPPDTFREKRLYFQRLVAGMRLPLAIFCLNDRLASRVCSWCLDMGLEIPEQVTILGMGNDLLQCECSLVPISSLDWQSAHRGEEGAKLLERMMNGESVPDQTVPVPPGEVVTRRSTDILAIADFTSARALRYIWDHYRENIGPVEIAAACGISRRNLDRHFLAVLGRTVNKELTRYRLLKACELLTTTNITATEVSVQAGFSTPQYFTLRFKDAFGLAPVRYREREKIKQRH